MLTAALPIPAIVVPILVIAPTGVSTLLDVNLSAAVSAANWAANAAAVAFASTS